jgi:hypothetical protein
VLPATDLQRDRTQCKIKEEDFDVEVLLRWRKAHHTERNRVMMCCEKVENQDVAPPDAGVIYKRRRFLTLKQIHPNRIALDRVVHVGVEMSSINQASTSSTSEHYKLTRPPF